MTRTKRTEGEKTFQYQDTLPSLPVPELAHTFDQYLQSIQPHVTLQEYETTRQLVDDFIKPGGEGERLHQMIVDRAKDSRNWLEDWWDYAAYLSWRPPIAIGINMFTGFGSFTEFSTPVPQARRAAEIIRYTCEYHELLKQQRIRPERMGGRVMCMNMFTRIFSVCRVPGDPADEFHRFDSSSVRHVVVFCKNASFALQVYDDSDDSLLTIGDLEVQLQRILKHAEFLKSRHSIGSLTSTDRTTWAKARKELCAADLSNDRHLHDIESALFAVCLDDTSPSSPVELIQQTAAGDCRNRWFDKSLQYMVFQNGIVGSNMEHGNADATVFMSMFRWLGQRYLERAGGIDTLIESRRDTYLPPPNVLNWRLNPSLIADIAQAEHSFEIRSRDFSPAVERYKGYGRTWIKAQHLPPDSYVQMAIQLAYYTLFGECCSTYESAHTRFFYHGRTETIRSCTNASVEWCRAMRSTRCSREKMDKLQTAIEKHTEIGMNALNGQGCDRHLLGLQIASMLSPSSDATSDTVFTDSSYAKSGGGGTFKLSTSNVSGYQWLWGGFSPMIASGFGICYDIDFEFLGFLITTYRAEQPVESNIFGQTLFQCLNEMKELILTTKPSKL